MFSLVDDDVNILRTTTALLGGAIGGADQLSAHPHDCLGGNSTAGRRLANAAASVDRESGLAQSLDAAGGAGFIEARSDQLADAAWRHFQKIEAGGGAKWPICQASLTCWQKPQASVMLGLRRVICRLWGKFAAQRTSGCFKFATMENVASPSCCH